MRFQLSLILIIGCFIFSHSIVAQTKNPEPKTDTYSINGFNPSGNGFILTNLQFASKVVLDQPQPDKLEWKATVSFKSCTVEGYLYNGTTYSKSQLINDFGLTESHFQSVKLKSVNVTFNNGKSFKANSLGLRGFDYSNLAYSKGDENTDFNIREIAIVTASGLGIETKIKSGLEQKEKLKKKEEAELKKIEAEKEVELKNKTTSSKDNDDDFWNGKNDNATSTSKTNEDDFWNGKSDKISDSKVEDDFWNGKEKSSKTENTSTTKSNINVELEITEDNTNLRNLGTHDLIFPEGKFYYFNKLESGFFAGVESDSRNFENENPKAHNNKFLIDKNGKILIENIKNVSVNKYDSELIIETYISIVYDPISISRGVWGTTKYTHEVKYVEDVYDFNMNLLSTSSKTTHRSL